MNKRINSKKDVLSIIQQNRKSIKTLGVKKLGLFGSLFEKNKIKTAI